MLVLHVVKHKRVFLCLSAHFFAQNVKNLQNINLDTIKQVFTAINGIRIVKLEGIDTKIKLLSLKMQKLQPKMFILATVHAIAPRDLLGINFFENFFADVVFSPK